MWSIKFTQILFRFDILKDKLNIKNTRVRKETAQSHQFLNLIWVSNEIKKSTLFCRGWLVWHRMPPKLAIKIHEKLYFRILSSHDNFLFVFQRILPSTLLTSLHYKFPINQHLSEIQNKKTTSLDHLFNDNEGEGCWRRGVKLRKILKIN